MMEQEKRLIIELLQLYRDFPCLWHQSHLLYNNREAREQAYNIVLEKYKAIREDATIEHLKKKLDNMRATYKREYKKVQLARVNEHREYRPTLWYYKYFAFLDDCEYQNESETNASLEEDQEEEIHEEFNSESEVEDEPKPKKSRGTAVYLKEPRMNEDCQKLFNYSLNTQSSTHESNETEAFGKAVSLQLRELNSMQRTIAEKLISDVIFHGRINVLTVKSSINISGIS